MFYLTRFALTLANRLADNLPNHISETLLVAASKYENILQRHELCLWEARTLKGGVGRRKEGEIHKDLVAGRVKSRESKSLEKLS